MKRRLMRAERAKRGSDMGKVYLVGAGPGDRELITVKGLNILKAADAVLYDSLIDPLLLEETRPDCERIGVGKRMGLHSCTQEEIVDMLLKAASCHEIVVRLKGGDPEACERSVRSALRSPLFSWQLFQLEQILQPSDPRLPVYI